MSNLDKDLAFCKAELRRLNPIHHFTALAVAESHRADIIAFYAFLAEIARIPRLVSDPGTGEIRLQWWIDVVSGDIEDIGSGCGGANIGPIGMGLKHVQKKYDLSPDLLSQIVEARKFDLYHDPMPHSEAFTTYAHRTRAIPLLLSAKILSDGTDHDLNGLYDNAGMAISLSNHLRRWAKVASYQQLFLPLDRFADQNVGLDQIFKRKRTDQMTSVLLEMMKQMDEHYQLAMDHYGLLKQRGLSHLAPAFLELALIPLVLKKRQYDLYGEIAVPNWRAYWSIWRMGARS